MVLQLATSTSPLCCDFFSKRKNIFVPFVSNPIRFNLCPCANNSDARRTRERRRLVKNVRLAFLRAQACMSGGSSPHHFNSATVRGAKKIAVKRFADEVEHNSGSFSSINATSSSHYYSTSFGQDPIVDKLRNQLGIIHPIPSPPINRSFFGLFAFFFFVGVIFDKLWTSRKTGARDGGGNKSSSRPQVPTDLSILLERDLQRKESVEWVNMVLGKLWKVYRDGIENWIIGLLQPVIDNLQKPDYVQRVEIKQFSLGDEPLSVRSVERRTSRRVNDLQYQIGLRYSGGARMLLLLSLKIGILPIVVPVGVRNFDIDGELWVKFRLIPKEPYVGAVSWAFVSLPKIKFELSPFRLFNLMAIPVLSMFLTKLLTEDLPKLFVRPKKIVLDFQNAKAVVPLPSDFAKSGEIQEGNSNYAGELSVTLLDARKLPYIFYGKTDPYVILRLGDQVIRSKRNSQTTVIGPPGEPIWNQDFHMLVSNPRKENLCIEVKDSLGFTDWTVGNAEIDLGPLKDTVPTDRIVQLRGGLSLFGKGYAGEILLRLTYKAYVEDEEDEKSGKAYNTDTDPSEDELSDSDQSYPTKSKRVDEKYTIDSEMDSFMDVLKALLVSEEFRGIVTSEAASTKASDDSGKNAAAPGPKGPGPQVAGNDSGTSEGSGSVLFWLALLTTIAVLIALNMGGGSSLFNP